MMKITTTNKELENAPKAYVTVELKEDVKTHVKETSGREVLVVGTQKRGEINERKFRSLSREVIRTAKKHGFEKLAVQFSRLPFPELKDKPEEWFLKTMAEEFVLADYEFDIYKNKKEARVKEVLICGGGEKRAVEEGATIAEYTNIARDIANTPGGAMTPELLAKDARKAVRGTGAKVSVLGKAQVEKLKMGALLGVAQGSKLGPRFIVVEWWGAKKPGASSRSKESGRGKGAEENNPIVFLGKGITFDTGGLNVKPGDSMLDMHLDMSGGAAVIGAVAACAKLKLKKNIIGLIPAAENSVSDESMRPGDILTSMSGKTIDVLNTDAEGRLILADGLTYAQKYNPKLVVDVATLTGAALVALGEHASAVLSKDEKLSRNIALWGEEAGEYAWPLPLWDEYIQYTKGRFGDVANIPSSGNTRYGGTINGAAFLSNFVEGYEWAHIDMAPRMTANASDKLAKGATGEPTRLLITIAKNA